MLSAADFTDFLRDESRSAGFADTISFPKSEKEITDTARSCFEDGTMLTIQGGRTGLAAGAVPHGGHVLNLSRMTRILGMRRDGDGAFFVCVEPGVVLAELRKAIESKKIPTSAFDDASMKVYKEFSSSRPLFFPPDPTEASATIGGMVSCNASGAKSYMYGATRNWVEGLHVVLADGEMVNLRRGDCRANGRVLTLTTESGKTVTLELPKYRMPDTKNASGYFVTDDMDAVDLFIGSDGTLGIISQIELKLCEEPAVMWGITCFFSGEEKAADFVIKTRKTVDCLSSIEYFDNGALDMLRAQKKNTKAFERLPAIPDGAYCAVYTELHVSSEQAAYDRLFAIGDIMRENGSDEASTWVARNARDRDLLYFFRHATPESVNMTIDKRKKEFPELTKLGSDMSVPDDRLAEVIDMYNRDLAVAGLEYVKFGHIGNNHLHVNILPRNPDEYKKGKAVFAEWAKRITKMGGAVSAEHGIGKLKAGFLEIMYGRDNIAEMVQLKLALDPKAILGNGNLFNIADYNK